MHSLAGGAGERSIQRILDGPRFLRGCGHEIALLLEEPGWRLTDAEPMVVTSFRLA
jgi:hypothetical protein